MRMFLRPVVRTRMPEPRNSSPFRNSGAGFWSPLMRVELLESAHEDIVDAFLLYERQ